MMREKLKTYRYTTIFAILTLFVSTQAFGYSVVFLLFTILTYLKEKQIKEMGERIIRFKNAIEKKDS